VPAGWPTARSQSSSHSRIVPSELPDSAQRPSGVRAMSRFKPTSRRSSHPQSGQDPPTRHRRAKPTVI
jgi:hypothetical protein